MSERPARQRPAHLELGLEGAALLREWLVGNPGRIQERIDRIAALVRNDGTTDPDAYVEIPEANVREGYARWSATYDQRPNTLALLEERVVHPLFASFPVGRALDVGTGTGRHAQSLAQLGHQVVALDVSLPMLHAVQAKALRVGCVAGTVEALPLASASVDLAVCALALTHLPTLQPALTELARVVCPGGRLVITDVHPLVVAFGGHAALQTADRQWQFIRNHLHLHSTYLTVFAQAGLAVRACYEPSFTEAEVGLRKAEAGRMVAASFPEAFLGLPGVLIWELGRS